MKVDDRIINYEINKQLSNCGTNRTGKVDKQQDSDELKAGAEKRSEQDTIVNLSHTSKEVRLIKEAISSEPDVREDKVSALKERIESGTYEVDHEELAGKLVDAFLEEIV